MPSNTLVDQLDRVVPQLDRLIADVRLGIPKPSTRLYDDLEERAQAIAAAIVASFRQPTPATRKPLHVEQREDGSVRAAW